MNQFLELMPSFLLLDQIFTPFHLTLKWVSVPLGLQLTYANSHKDSLARRALFGPLAPLFDIPGPNSHLDGWHGR